MQPQTATARAWEVIAAEHDKLTPGQQLSLLALAARADATTPIRWHDSNAIARMTGNAPNGQRKILLDLARRGLVERHLTRASYRLAA
jgi:DNA-binding MarR family transcriptional regulator